MHEENVKECLDSGSKNNCSVITLLLWNSYNRENFLKKISYNNLKKKSVFKIVINKKLHISKHSRKMIL